ncbi:MAG TPA: hypothetical protein VFV66_07585 [Nonomuraea sp.]|nr:hypothetical protein [Nonomuraea sp.]
MKRLLTAAGIAVALATVASVSSAVAAGSAQAASDLPIHRGKYWSHSACITAGQQGVDRGHWSRYQCAEGTWFWNLWTDR